MEIKTITKKSAITKINGNKIDPVTTFTSLASIFKIFDIFINLGADPDN